MKAGDPIWYRQTWSEYRRHSWVAATFVATTPKRVLIEVPLSSGRSVRMYVLPINVKPREDPQRRMRTP